MPRHAQIWANYQEVHLGSLIDSLLLKSVKNKSALAFPNEIVLDSLMGLIIVEIWVKKYG